MISPLKNPSVHRPLPADEEDLAIKALAEAHKGRTVMIVAREVYLLRRIQDAVLTILDRAQSPPKHVLDERRRRIVVYNQDIRFTTRSTCRIDMHGMHGKVFFFGFFPDIDEAEIAASRDR